MDVNLSPGVCVDTRMFGSCVSGFVYVQMFLVLVYMVTSMLGCVCVGARAGYVCTDLPA